MVKTFSFRNPCQNIFCAVKIALIELATDKPIYKSDQKLCFAIYLISPIKNNIRNAKELIYKSLLDISLIRNFS